ncbi:unnamed protein product, partial [Brassica napus]
GVCVCVLGPNLAFRSRLRQMNHADKPKTETGVRVRP